MTTYKPITESRNLFHWLTLEIKYLKNLTVEHQKHYPKTPLSTGLINWIANEMRNKHVKAKYR